jgi:hypothetical protein
MLHRPPANEHVADHRAVGTHAYGRPAKLRVGNMSERRIASSFAADNIFPAWRQVGKPGVPRPGSPRITCRFPQGTVYSPVGPEWPRTKRSTS